MKKNVAIALVPSFAMALAGPANAVELLSNGDFEAGSFTGWTNEALTGSASAGFFLDTPGTTTPISSSPTAVNPAGGSFYSVSDQNGPGTYALLQSFTVPVGATSVSLAFDMFVNDQSGAGPIVDPIGLDHTGPDNQHARVDILTDTSTAFSTAAADIITNLYLGIDFGTNPNPYTSYLFDLTPLLTPGTMYQVRFAEVDNQGFFQQGVDNVSVTSTQGAVPEPTTVLLLAAGFAGLGYRRHRPRRSSHDIRGQEG